MSDYYRDQAAAYFARTADLDPTPFLAPLLRVLPSGARVLDVGSGSGRDLLWLQRHGFRPVGLERSPELAALARAHSGCPVVVADFETHDFAVCDVDAILLVGALVHLPHDRLEPAIRNILRALDPRAPEGGWVFLSLKQGHGRRSDRAGRTFYLWQEEALVSILTALDLAVRHRAVSESAAGTGERWLGFVLRHAVGAPEAGGKKRGGDSGAIGDQRRRPGSGEAVAVDGKGV